jgi:galactose mutarotase-like enzyme
MVTPTDAVAARTTWRGESALEHAGGGTRVVVAPGRGGKIVSLRFGLDADPGAPEWCAQPATGEALSPVGSGGSFVAGDMTGWDDCVPSLAACRTPDGVDVPDHGEAWDAAWTVDVAGDLVAGLPGYGGTLRRGVRVSDDGVVRLDYEVAAGARPQPFLWVAHPQLVAPPGTHVVVEGDVSGHCWDMSRTPGRPPERVPFPGATAALADVPPGTGRKLYLDPDDRADAVHVDRGDGHRLTLRWSGRVPYLGLWFDRARHAREDVVAVEPCTGWYDSLATAMGNGTALVAEPGAPVRWSVELTAGAVPA